jgi:hypothetical protein
MDTIIVTVTRAGEAQERDLVVQPDVPVAQLAAYIAEGLRWNTGGQGQSIIYEVEAVPPGRKLMPQETLASAQVWDGARLTFHPVAQSAAAPANISPVSSVASKVEAQPASDHPVVGRRQLRTPVKDDAPDAESPTGSNGYILKRVDDD